MSASVPNIGPRQQRRRLASGLVSLVLSAALAGVLVGIDASIAVRSLVVLPLYAAALGFLQHREKT
jgi:hypothetical protein